MPSSTSSFDRPVPAAPYLKQWLLAVALAAVWLAGGEMFWRSQGQIASIVDDKTFWAYHRGHVYEEDGTPRTVIIGTSRSLLGLDPRILEAEIPGFQVVHLAVNGALPYRALEDLAHDTEFNGIIIADVTARDFTDAGLDAQRPWVQYYQDYWGHMGRLERLTDMSIRHWVQKRLAVFGTASFRQQIDWSLGDAAPLGYITVRKDRYFSASYYTRMTPDQLTQHRALRIAKVRDLEPAGRRNRSEVLEEFRANIKTKVLPLVKAIQERGGQVIFVRMPTADEYWDHDEEFYPRSVYWDYLARTLPAPTIHFQDHPSLNRFHLPDNSHLDSSDAPEFTRRLAEIIRPYISSLPLR